MYWKMTGGIREISLEDQLVPEKPWRMLQRRSKVWGADGQIGSNVVVRWLIHMSPYVT